VSDGAIRDGVLDWFFRAEQTGYMDQLFKEQIAPVLADKLNAQLERDLAASRAEIDKTYKAWCGRDYMHLPLCEAVGKAMEAARAECAELRAKLTTVQADAERDQRNAAMSQREAAVLLDENKELRERLDRATECLMFIAGQGDLAGNWAVEKARRTLDEIAVMTYKPTERGEGVKG